MTTPPSACSTWLQVGGIGWPSAPAVAWGPLIRISDSPFSRRITARASVQCSAHAAEPGPFHHHGLVNDDDGLALALDVGGTTIKAELVDRAGAVVASEQRPTPQGHRARDAVAEVGRTLLPQRPDAPVVGAGVVVPGRAGEGLLDPLRVALRQRTPVVHPADVTVSALGGRGGVVGAALLARDGWAPES